MHSLQLDIKKQADQKIEEFLSRFGEKMNDEFDLYSENKQYLLFIKLKQNITMDYQNLIEQSQEKMKQHNISYYSWIKKCPNCQRVWVKVAGCGGETYCGNKVNEFDKDQQRKQENSFQRYEFYIKNEKLVCQKVQEHQSWNAKTALSQYAIENKFVETKNPDEAFEIIRNKLNQNSYKAKLKLENLIKKCEELHNLTGRELSMFWSEYYCFQVCFKKFHLFQFYKKQLIDEIFQPINDQFMRQKIKDSQLLKQLFTLLLENGQYQNTVDNFLEQITKTNQAKYLSLLRSLFLQGQNLQTKLNESEGCNFKFVWDEQPPLSEQELKALFSPDVFDYVTDRVNLETDEDDATKKELLKTLNLAIGEKLKTVQISQTQQGK